MAIINLRLSGTGGAIDKMLDALRGLPHVDRVEEMGVAQLPRMDDDSSSAVLSADVGEDATRDVEIHAGNAAAAQRVRDATEIAARAGGIVVEWLDRF